jgi:hypothetical protein
VLQEAVDAHAVTAPGAPEIRAGVMRGTQALEAGLERMTGLEPAIFSLGS